MQSRANWNGSAKVALLSIERSHTAWRTVAALTADEAARVLGDNLAQLRVDLLKEFPRAMKFRRPGSTADVRLRQLRTRKLMPFIDSLGPVEHHCLEETGGIQFQIVERPNAARFTRAGEGRRPRRATRP